MQISTKDNDRLSEDPDDNSYINKMPLSKVRVWTADSSQKILTKLKNIYNFVRGRDLRGGYWTWRGLLDFWRRRNNKMAAVT